MADDVLDTFSRCHTSYRLFMSSTGNASGGFYQIMTAKSLAKNADRLLSSQNLGETMVVTVAGRS